EDDAVVAITRDYLNDPFRGTRCQWHIEALDRPPTVRLTDDDLARRFRAALTWVQDQAAMVPLALGAPNQIDEPDPVQSVGVGWAAGGGPTQTGEPYPVQSVTFGWAAGDAAYAMGSFDLADAEALVIRGRS